MADFVHVSKEVVSLWLREKKTTYAPIPDKLNGNKKEVQAKAIFVETENRLSLHPFWSVSIAMKCSMDMDM